MMGPNDSDNPSLVYSKTLEKYNDDLVGFLKGLTVDRRMLAAQIMGYALQVRVDYGLQREYEKDCTDLLIQAGNIQPPGVIVGHPVLMPSLGDIECSMYESLRYDIARPAALPYLMKGCWNARSIIQSDFDRSFSGIEVTLVVIPRHGPLVNWYEPGGVRDSLSDSLGGLLRSLGPCVLAHTSDFSRIFCGELTVNIYDSINGYPDYSLMTWVQLGEVHREKLKALIEKSSIVITDETPISEVF